jgi:hypothetical protein
MDAAINFINIQHKKGSFPSTLVSHNRLIYFAIYAPTEQDIFHRGTTSAA